MNVKLLLLPSARCLFCIWQLYLFGLYCELNFFSFIWKMLVIQLTVLLGAVLLLSLSLSLSNQGMMFGIPKRNGYLMGSSDFLSSLFCFIIPAYFSHRQLHVLLF